MSESTRYGSIGGCLGSETLLSVVLGALGDTEEILLILDGQGEAWVDGETAPFRKGDVVLFPANSKHMVRNTGSQPLVAAAIFSPPTSAESYVLFDESEGW